MKLIETNNDDEKYLVVWHIIQNKHTMVSLNGKCLFYSLDEILHAANGKVKKNTNMWAPRKYKVLAEFKKPIELQGIFAEYLI